MYKKFFKRFFDLVLSVIALIVLSPLLLILMIVGAIVMKGNPIFIQKRPGMIDKKTGEERIISLLKFRTMTNERDFEGNLLPDEKRLVPYGKFLRSTSLDESISIVQVITGELSLVGPRPLLVEYLPWYTEKERKRHTVRPGITGWAQVNGRNALSWEGKFAHDLEYIEKCSLLFDVKILFLTVGKVLSRSDISTSTGIVETNFAKERQAAQMSQEVTNG